MLELPEKNKKLLLHTCCAPCSGAIVKELKKSKVDFTVLFYNPNIFPQKEYDIRKNELIKYCQKESIPLIISEGGESVKQWEDSVKGLELEPERGNRCRKCITHRLEKSAKFAFKNDFDILATTLSASRWKDLLLVNDCGIDAVKDYVGVDFWDVKWHEFITPEQNKKVSDEEDFYRQRYCGCFYSIGDNLK